MFIKILTYLTIVMSWVSCIVVFIATLEQTRVVKKLRYIIIPGLQILSTTIVPITGTSPRIVSYMNFTGYLLASSSYRSRLEIQSVLSVPHRTDQSVIQYSSDDQI